MRAIGAGLRAGVTALATMLAVSAAADAPRQPPAAMVPVDALAAALAAWIGAEFALDAPPRLPRIAFAAPERLDALYRAGGAHGFGGVAALYDQRRETILLPFGWEGSNPAEVSVLVHEMMHHLQHTSGRVFACAAEREAQAYDAQARWLERFGEDLKKAFAIDPLFLILLRACGF
jgi:hypothetical protein